MRLLSFCVLLLLSAPVALAQDTNFASGPQYLATYGSPSFARPISTPTLSLAGPALEIGASNATEGLIAGAGNRTVEIPSPDAPPAVDLFPILYGRQPSGLIEIGLPNGASSATMLPAGILDVGVWQATTAQELGKRGYGPTLAEAVAYEKTLVRHATRVYTNADIDRLRGSS